MDIDHGKLALDFLRMPNTYLGMIKEGATCTMEAWNTDEKPNLSWSHPWATAPASAIVWGLFGIQATSPGYATLDIKPQPGDLEWASVTVPTNRGERIIARFNSTPHSFSLEIDVPLNISARACVPTLSSLKNSVCLNDERIVGDISRNHEYICIAELSGKNVIRRSC